MRPGVRRRLTGMHNIVVVLAVFAMTAVLALVLLRHSQVRFEMLDVAHERSRAAWMQRALRDQARHLELERAYRARTLRLGADVRDELGVERAEPWQYVTMEVFR